jgi:hypothetical protein
VQKRRKIEGDYKEMKNQGVTCKCKKGGCEEFIGTCYDGGEDGGL